MTPARADRHAAHAHPGGLVLVVDDYDGAADMLGEYIQLTCHCDVATALDGAQAVQAVQARHPDAIVMDIDMPVMDGVEAARVVRQMFPASPPPLLVALTGGTQLRRAETCSYFDHVLSKPADIGALSELLLDFLDERGT